MITFSDNYYLAFGGIGFINGFVDLWESFNENTFYLKKIAPSITNGIIFAIGYLSIPYFTESIFQKIATIQPNFEDIYHPRFNN